MYCSIIKVSITFQQVSQPLYWHPYWDTLPNLNKYQFTIHIFDSTTLTEMNHQIMFQQTQFTRFMHPLNFFVVYHTFYLVGMLLKLTKY